MRTSNLDEFLSLHYEVCLFFLTWQLWGLWNRLRVAVMVHQTIDRSGISKDILKMNGTLKHPFSFSIFCFEKGKA